MKDKKWKAKPSLEKLVRQQGVKPFDPSEELDWGIPTDDEIKRYDEAMRRRSDR